MRRRWFMLATLTSLLLFVATTVFWALSYSFYTSALHTIRSGAGLEFYSFTGRVIVLRYSNSQRGLPWSEWHFDVLPLNSNDAMWFRLFLTQDIPLAQRERFDRWGFAATSESLVLPGTRRWMISFPHWVMLVP